MTIVLGLCGYAGSGKDSVASILVEEKGYTKLSFAEHLKDCAAYMFRLPRHLLEGDTDESRKYREEPIPEYEGVTPRAILQLLGTEICKQIYKDYWAFILANKIKELHHRNPRSRFVVTDLRFLNEYHFLKDLAEDVLDLSTEIVYVDRQEAYPAWYKRLFPKLFRLHASERNVPELRELADLCFDNNSSLEELRKKVLAVYG